MGMMVHTILIVFYRQVLLQLVTSLKSYYSFIVFIIIILIRIFEIQDDVFESNT